MKNWVTAKEIAGIGGLSKHPTNVNRLARKEKWIFREIQGVQGGGYEYSFSSLPLEVQTEYLLKHSEELKVNKENNDSNQQTMIESAWNVLASATFEQEKRAERRFQAVVKVARLVENKIPLMKAFEQVVALYATDSNDETISKGSLKRWWYKVKHTHKAFGYLFCSTEQKEITAVVGQIFQTKHGHSLRRLPTQKQTKI